MENAVPHIVGFLMCMIGPMVLSGGIERTSPDAIVAEILEERIWHCKAMLAGKMNDLAPARAGPARWPRAPPAPTESGG
jgi:hypothetical protein